MTESIKGRCSTCGGQGGSPIHLKHYKETRMAYQLTIKDPGTLLSMVTRQDITPAQVSIVMAVLADPTLTYGDVLAFLARRRSEAARVIEDYPAGAGEEVEAFRG